MTHPLLHLARDNKERASSIDEQRIDGALGIALFFSLFLLASSDPFVRNFFVPSFVEPLLILNFVREGTGLLTGQPFFMRRFTLKGKLALLLWALGAPVVREKEK